MAALESDIRTLKGVGEVRARSLAKLGITDLRSLLRYFPRAYDDRRGEKKIAEVLDGESACVAAVVADVKTARLRRGLDITKARVVDETGALEIVFFNQSYRAATLSVGESFVFFGRVERTGRRRQMQNPVYEREGAHRLTGRLMPIYPLSAGVTQQMLCGAMEQGLSLCAPELRETLPRELREAHGLCPVREAYENIHFPESSEALAAARRHLAFEELFYLALGMGLLRQRRGRRGGEKCERAELSPFLEALPFPLTRAQKRAIDDITRDMASGQAMNRLCQGDVGSGKTMVAAAAIVIAAQNGLQSAFMAPTEILAEQHYRSLAPMLERLGIPCVLLTGAVKAKERRETLAAIESGEAGLVIGTHALLSPEVKYGWLGLVVTDEQHRFGVDQRAALTSKGESPHLLVMSATPIPRTLALMIYGDLDVSVLDELPPGRQKVDTFAVPTSYHERLYAFVRKLVGEGRQVYIVCPTVEEGEEADDGGRKAVTAYAETLRREAFPTLRVAVLHGRMKGREKDEVMRAFAAGEIDVLVATTVVEVGVDVPNAALMLVENAECFGLSQLHQLRGRVGRGAHKSYCVLVSDSASEESRTRLRVMSKTNDGFRIAEEDLKLRGPGDFFGRRQHGLPALHAADLSCDLALLHETQQAAAALLAEDRELAAHPALRERAEELFVRGAGAMN